MINLKSIWRDNSTFVKSALIGMVVYILLSEITMGLFAQRILVLSSLENTKNYLLVILLVVIFYIFF